MEKKESYIVIDGVRYDAVKQEGGTLGVCYGCVFNAGDGCALPKIYGFSIDCGEDTIFVSRGEVAAQQRHPSGEKDICRYLSFNLGNVVKYVCQASRKDAGKKVEDLRKAMDYLVDEIKRMEEGGD